MDEATRILATGEKAIAQVRAMTKRLGGTSVAVLGGPRVRIWWGRTDAHAMYRGGLNIRRRDAIRRWRAKHG